MLRITETEQISTGKMPLTKAPVSTYQVRVKEYTYLDIAEALKGYDAHLFDESCPCWMPESVWMILATVKRGGK